MESPYNQLVKLNNLFTYYEQNTCSPKSQPTGLQIHNFNRFPIPYIFLPKENEKLVSENNLESPKKHIINKQYGRYMRIKLTKQQGASTNIQSLKQPGLARQSSIIVGQRRRNAKVDPATSKSQHQSWKLSFSQKLENTNARQIGASQAQSEEKHWFDHIQKVYGGRLINFELKKETHQALNTFYSNFKEIKQWA